MPGDSPHEAFRAFVEPLRTAVSILGPARFVHAPLELGRLNTLTLRNPISVESSIHGTLSLSVRFGFTTR